MSDAKAFEGCVRGGGVVLFAADTVYGLACGPENEAALGRLYALKRRLPAKAAAVMFFDLEQALEALPELDPVLEPALRALLPGPVTILLPNPGRRFPLACAGDPLTLGLRVPIVPALADVRCPVLQSSANRAGGKEARRLAEVPAAIRAGADLALNGGETPGIASTVVDLRHYAERGEWLVLREGAVGSETLAGVLG